MFALIKSVCNWLENHSATVTTIATVVLTITTVVLAVLTYSYLQVTKKAVWVQTTPKVFIKKIESTVRPDYDKNQLVVQSIVIFTNCGNTEAKNLEWSYTIEVDGQELVKKDKRRVSYLYPEQNGAFTIEHFRIKFSPEQIKIIKQSQEPGNKLTFTPSVVKPIFLNIEYEYDDQDGKRIPSRAEQHKYLFAQNRWAIPIQKD